MYSFPVCVQSLTINRTRFAGGGRPRRTEDAIPVVAVLIGMLEPWGQPCAPRRHAPLTMWADFRPPNERGRSTTFGGGQAPPALARLPAPRPRTRLVDRRPRLVVQCLSATLLVKRTVARKRVCPCSFTRRAAASEPPGVSRFSPPARPCPRDQARSG